MAGPVNTKRPRVNLGLMTFGPPGTETHGTRITSLEDFNECLDYYQSRGYNEVDTARTYVDGLQEGWTKAAKWRERKLTLATKWWPSKPGDHSRSRVKENLTKSLQELGTDCVDIFYLHAPDRSVPFQETLEACNELYQEGKFKQLGLSNYMAWEVAEIWNIADQQGWVKPTVYQALYNCLARTIEEELVPCCRKYNIDILVYNMLAGGLLTGKVRQKEIPKEGRYADSGEIGALYRMRYFRNASFQALDLINPVVERHGLTLVETAVRWCVHHSALKVHSGSDGIVIGVSSLAQLRANLDELEKGPLQQEVVETLEAAWQITKGSCVSYWDNV